MYFQDQIRPKQAPARITGFNRLTSPDRFRREQRTEANRTRSFMTALAPISSRPSRASPRQFPQQHQQHQQHQDHQQYAGYPMQVPSNAASQVSEQEEDILYGTNSMSV